ncbi:MAG: hypothetical protein PHY56_08290 [Candidatus Omnitrophica bacterium]|nr:hypothetical protein [Candidatus Omnitrophota bacterium]
MVETKICTKCHRILPKDERYFPPRKDSPSGLNSRCRDCYNEIKKLFLRQYYKIHPEKIRHNSLKYSLEYSREANKRSYQKHIIERRTKNNLYYFNNKERINLKRKEFRINNPDIIRKYKRTEYPKRIRIIESFRSNIYASLKYNKKGRHWEDIVGYTCQDLIEHIEKLFKRGMAWENYGKWHVDHIIPISAFKYSSYDDPEFKACWALTNLRPLWAIDNLKKKDKIIDRKLRLF